MDLNPIILGVSAIGAAAGVAAFVDQRVNAPRTIFLVQMERSRIVVNNKVEIDAKFHNTGSQPMIAPTLKASDGVALNNFGNFGSLMPGEQLSGFIQIPHPNTELELFVDFSWLESRGNKQIEQVRRVTLPGFQILRRKGRKWKTAIDASPRSAG